MKFNEWKTSAKVVAGFGAMMTILATLGVAGYLMFGRVQSNVTELSDHSLAAVKNATGVERSAFQTIVAEEKYLNYKKDEFNRGAKNGLVELVASLDAVDKVAEKFNDAALAKKSKDVRALAAKFGKQFDEGVEAIKANELATEQMALRGNAVQKVTEAYMNAKKAEYLEAKDSLAIANRIQALTWQMRYARQKAKYDKSKKHLEMVENGAAALIDEYHRLEAMHPNAKEQAQIQEASRATQEYATTEKNHFEAQQRGAKDAKLNEIDAKNHEAGETVGKIVEDYLAAKKAKVDQLAEAVFIVSDVAATAPRARLRVVMYMASRDPEDWDKFSDHMGRLLNDYDELRRVLLTPDDRRRMEQISKATQEYLDDAQLWQENDNKLHNTIMPGLKKGGDTVLLTAQAAENDAWKASDEHAASVGGIVASSKTLIIFTLLVGLAVVLVLGFVISKSIAKVLGTLIGQTTRLSQDAVEGKLQSRGNPELVSAEFRPIVEGVNATLDAVVGPLNVAAEYVDRISNGDIPASITDSYNGDFNEIKNNLNKCIDAVNLMTADAKMLADAATHGKLDTRADALKHNGDFRKIVEGVNGTIATLVGHLDAVPQPVMIIDNQFTVQYMNDAGANVIGKSKQQLTGTKCYEQFKTSDCNTSRCACAQAMQENRVASGETDAHPNGLNLDISYAAVPIRDGHGLVIGALELVTDQTAVRQAARVADKVAKYQEGEVGKVSGVLDKMANGDLTQRYTVGDADGDTADVAKNFAAVGTALNGTIANLSSMIQNVAESANQFAEGARVIAESSQTLAQGAQTQTSSVEEMNAAIEELARSVQVVKENAEMADKVAKEANQLAENGGVAVQKSVQSMGQIRTSSQQIAEIIQVISEIASQTNLLALNAAIEAARAGEHGMGFAVVADEVRKLAERSNQAAREISTLIKESTQRVEEGAQLSDQTGESLKRIITAAEGTAAKIAEIAAATIQQAANAEEVSKAIQGVAQVTEQSAAGSEEMASSSEELGAQAAALRELVAEFNVG